MKGYSGVTQDDRLNFRQIHPELFARGLLVAHPNSAPAIFAVGLLATLLAGPAISALVDTRPNLRFNPLPPEDLSHYLELLHWLSELATSASGTSWSSTWAPYAFAYDSV